jgi:hypothetical protein
LGLPHGFLARSSHALGFGKVAQLHPAQPSGSKRLRILHRIPATQLKYRAQKIMAANNFI